MNEEEKDLSIEAWKKEGKTSLLMEKMVTDFLVRFAASFHDFERMARLGILPNNHQTLDVIMQMSTYLKSIDYIPSTLHDRITAIYNERYQHFQKDLLVEEDIQDENAALISKVEERPTLS